ALANLRMRVGFALKGFGAAPPEPSSLAWSRPESCFRIPVDPKDLPVPNLPRFALALHGAQNMGSGDKMAWEYVFMFEESACSLTFEKYGLRLHVARLPGMD